VYAGHRLGHIFVDYLLPFSYAVVTALAARRGNGSAPAPVYDALEAPSPALPPAIRRVMQGSTMVAWFAGLDGGGLRDMVLSPSADAVPRVLAFVTRRHARAVVNDAEMRAHLAAWCAARGWRFEVIDLGDDRDGKALSFADQAAHFASIGILVAMHGAALFNAGACVCGVARACGHA
jgi:hypothetical protein